MIIFMDEVLVCQECGEEFVFTAGEQEFYAVQGFLNPPKYCPACREQRKRRNGANGNKTMIVCAACGKVDYVSFKPKGVSPVYCEECYRRSEKRLPNR